MGTFVAAEGHGGEQRAPICNLKKMTFSLRLWSPVWHGASPHMRPISPILNSLAPNGAYAPAFFSSFVIA